MKHILLFILALFITPHIAHAEDKTHAITVEQAYAYPTSESMKNGAVFLTIHNTMPMPDRVIAAFADEVTDHAELHTHIMDGDKMMMREVEAYDIPAGEITKLNPMGHHIMLMGLKKPLVEGETFRLTLDFERGDDITTTVTVGAPE